MDVALVSRYLGSKEALFAEVLKGCPSPERFFEGDVAEFGARVARILVLEPLAHDDLTTLLIILNSASSENAASAILTSSRERFLQPLTDLLDGPDARMRAQLIANIIKGVAIDRVISRDAELDGENRQAFCDLLADSLQALVDR